MPARKSGVGGTWLTCASAKRKIRGWPWHRRARTDREHSDQEHDRLRLGEAEGSLDGRRDVVDSETRTDVRVELDVQVAVQLDEKCAQVDASERESGADG